MTVILVRALAGAIGAFAIVIALPRLLRALWFWLHDTLQEE